MGDGLGVCPGIFPGALQLAGACAGKINRQGAGKAGNPKSKIARAAEVAEAVALGGGLEGMAAVRFGPAAQSVELDIDRHFATNINVKISRIEVNHSL
ncbi:MAG: hypothetical protein FWG10_07860 [Eubacteriaceae bacterium]|nr:hypothetical protein [Eubacteriaceae bacterium]